MVYWWCVIVSCTQRCKRYKNLEEIHKRCASLFRILSQNRTLCKLTLIDLLFYILNRLDFHDQHMTKNFNQTSRTHMSLVVSRRDICKRGVLQTDSLVNLYRCWDSHKCKFVNHLTEKDLGVSATPTWILKLKTTSRMHMATERGEISNISISRGCYHKWKLCLPYWRYLAGNNFLT